MICEHCFDPPCVNACPTNAIKKGSDGIVRLNGNECISCKLCSLTCPFGALSFDLEKNVAILCDQCEGNPVCVKVCPTGAIEYVDKTRKNIQKKKDFMAKNIEIRRNLPDFYINSGGGRV